MTPLVARTWGLLVGPGVAEIEGAIRHFPEQAWLTVQARTRSEARAAFKRMLGIAQLPSGLGRRGDLKEMA